MPCQAAKDKLSTQLFFFRTNISRKVILYALIICIFCAHPRLSVGTYQFYALRPAVAAFETLSKRADVAKRKVQKFSTPTRDGDERKIYDFFITRTLPAFAPKTTAVSAALNVSTAAELRAACAAFLVIADAVLLLLLFQATIAVRILPTRLH